MYVADKPADTVFISMAKEGYSCDASLLLELDMCVSRGIDAYTRRICESFFFTEISNISCVLSSLIRGGWGWIGIIVNELKNHFFNNLSLSCRIPVGFCPGWVCLNWICVLLEVMWPVMVQTLSDSYFVKLSRWLIYKLFVLNLKWLSVLVWWCAWVMHMCWS